MPEDIVEWLEDNSIVYDPEDNEEEITYEDVLLVLDKEDRLWK
jgi:hypothetical protein